MSKINNIEDIANEIRANKGEYGFKRSQEGRENLRRFQREMHGEPPENIDTEITKAPPNSALMWLNEGKRVQIIQFENNKSKPLRLGDGVPPQPGGMVIDGKKIKEAQERVEIWFDDNKVTPQQVYDIQRYKAGQDVNVPKGKSSEGYKLELEQLGSYVIIRGEVTQFHNPDGTLMDKPVDRVVYYANFPKLQKAGMHPESLDYQQFCDTKNKTLRPEQMDNLKEKFKDVIKLQARVAAAHGEAIDLVTPNAFFDGLEPDEQQKAKKLFATAIIEAAKEIDYKGFKGLLVHNDPGEMYQMITANKKDFKIPVIVNSGDSSAPSKIVAAHGANFKVADCIMGEACGPAGNGALGPRANKAKEENDTRVMGGTIQLSFGPQFNKRLLDINQYKAFKLPKEVDKFQAITAVDKPKVIHKSTSMEKLSKFKGWLENLFGINKQSEPNPQTLQQESSTPRASKPKAASSVMNELTASKQDVMQIMEPITVANASRKKNSHIAEKEIPPTQEKKKSQPRRKIILGGHRKR